MERYFNIGGPCNPAKHYTLLTDLKVENRL